MQSSTSLRCLQLLVSITLLTIEIFNMVLFELQKAKISSHLINQSGLQYIVTQAYISITKIFKLASYIFLHSASACAVKGI